MEQVIFTTLCMVSDGNGHVLVQQRIGGSWAGIAFPGGHVEPGESFTRSVIREVMEETGYIIEHPRLCGIKQFPLEDGGRYIVLLYKADRFQGTLCSSEEGNVFWLRRDEMQKCNLAPDMLEMLELFEDDTKSEFYYYEENGEWEYVII